MTGAGSRAGGGIAPAPIAADVGIVAAMGVEVGFLTDRLKRVRKYQGAGFKVIEGEAGDKIIAVLVGGVGRVNARRAAEALILGHRPSWVVSAGFAGALDPDLKRNQAVFPSTIVDQEGVRYNIGLSVLEAAENPSPRLRTGTLLTVDSIAFSSPEKAGLREKFGADLVDMESSAVAAVCSYRSIRFLPVRVISDEASAELPRELATLHNRKGGYLVGSALRAVWNRPSAIKDFWRLNEQAHEAADRLANITLAAIARLPG